MNSTKDTSRQLWLLAGGNGAGKSTFFRTQLARHQLPFVNADEIAKELFPQNPEAYSYQASQIAENLRIELLEEGVSFCFETVFSHPSKIDFLALAKSKGYEVILVFIHLSSPELNKARISQRIEEGGHAVPDEKVESRIPRTMQNIKTAIQIADKTYLLDNSSYDSPYQMLANVDHGEINLKDETPPDWVAFLLGM